MLNRLYLNKIKQPDFDNRIFSKSDEIAFKFFVTFMQIETQTKNISNSFANLF